MGKGIGFAQKLGKQKMQRLVFTNGQPKQLD